MAQDVVLSSEDVQALRDCVEVIVDLAQRTLDACTDFNETLGVGCGGGCKNEV